MLFPQYRKYSNNKKFYKIVSASELEEISFIGNKAILHKITAKILPDRNLFDDLLNDIPNSCLIATEEEYVTEFKKVPVN